jgi:parallel beta-helix repeat protein
MIQIGFLNGINTNLKLLIGFEDITFNKSIRRVNNPQNYASFEWTPTRPKTNEIIEFNASYSFTLDGVITTYSWDWDNDGNFDETNSDSIITNFWSNSGNYSVTLRIEDDKGQISTTTRIIFIIDEWNIIIPDDYSTIQHGIDNSNPGDRIFVKTGVYYEDLIVNQKILTIHGENMYDTHIIGTGNSHVIWITSNSCYINITGFTISGSNIYDSGIFIESDYNIIEKNIIQDTGVGIEVRRASGNQIKDNLIIGNSLGIVLNDNTHSNNIEGNIVKSNFDHGVYISSTSIGNSIYNCSISNNGDSGIYVKDIGKSNTITWNKIQDNNFGIKCDSISDGNLYHHNSLVNNKINAFDSSVNSWNAILAGSEGSQFLQGNFWSDYDGVDINGDGIGDTPYFVPGGNNKDNYPLMKQPSIYQNDVAGLYWYFSTIEFDHNRSHEIPELIEGDNVYFYTLWDVIPNHYLTESEYYSIEYEYYLDGEFYDYFNWEHQVEEYKWTPDIFAYAFYEWPHEKWNATPGNHTFKAIFDPYDKWQETNEGNNEIIADFYVSEKKDIIARFKWNPEQPEINEIVTFDASESYTPNEEIVRYEWDWDNDGVFDELVSIPMITHSWPDSGNYNITLNIVDINGENDILKRNIQVVKNRFIVVPDDYPSIQDAINNADQDVIIYLAPGVYNENIIIDKSIKLFGEDKETTILNGEGLENHIIRIDADNVEIAGLTIMNTDIAKSGIRIYGNFSNIHDNKIINCGGGIEVYWSNSNYLEFNEFIDNSWGIFISGSSRNEIIQNYFIENNYGIEIGISSAFIHSNNFHNNYDNGILLTQTMSVVIDSNNFYNNNGSGIIIFSSSYISIFDNLIESNNIDGISLHKSTNNNIFSNLITDNNNHPISFRYYSDNNIIDLNDINPKNITGLYIECSNNNIIENNKFFNTNPENNLHNVIGIYFTYSSNNNYIYHNNFFDNYIAYDEGNNQWDKGNIFGGNYWNIYYGLDINNDGIGDLPNNIHGGGRQDHYPFIYEWSPPNKPETPIGKIEGKIRKEYSYKTKAIDPDGDRIQFGWDWNGDKIIDEWTKFYNSGEIVNTYHKWIKNNTYEISVLARDEKSQISDWSDSIIVNIPKNKIFIEKKFQRLPILRNFFSNIS